MSSEPGVEAVLLAYHVHVTDNVSSKHPESQAKAMWGQSGVYTHSLKATWCRPQQNKSKDRCPFLHRTAECKGVKEDLHLLCQQLSAPGSWRTAS